MRDVGCGMWNVGCGSCVWYRYRYRHVYQFDFLPIDYFSFSLAYECWRFNLQSSTYIGDLRNFEWRMGSPPSRHPLLWWVLQPFDFCSSPSSILLSDSFMIKFRSWKDLSSIRPHITWCHCWPARIISNHLWSTLILLFRSHVTWSTPGFNDQELTLKPSSTFIGGLTQKRSLVTYPTFRTRTIPTSVHLLPRWIGKKSNGWGIIENSTPKSNCTN